MIIASLKNVPEFDYSLFYAKIGWSDPAALWWRFSVSRDVPSHSVRGGDSAP